MPSRRTRLVSAELQGLNKTLKRVGGLKHKVARQGLRHGYRKATQLATKRLKSAMPAGRTGLLKKSIAGKTSFDLKRYLAFGIAGQRRDKAANRRGVNANTANQRTRAAGIRGRISGGLTGRGFAPPIHLVDNATKSHEIEAKPGKQLFWRIVKGDQPIIPWARAQSVLHHGHSGKGIVARVERRTRLTRIRIIAREFHKRIRRSGL